ncbi:hypothetical protein NDU88_004065 [Pleurodeles waltl]|uniref:Uncharacterized protein n=1 Tax=Pleurodeles waltl TaxID=8319 RepID=A0AAV7W7Y6_PLEWA|nr:hypothetical protein NDU88_004065 [Pleurodeles waltl]
MGSAAAAWEETQRFSKSHLPLSDPLACSLDAETWKWRLSNTTAIHHNEPSKEGGEPQYTTAAHCLRLGRGSSWSLERAAVLVPRPRLRQLPGLGEVQAATWELIAA